MLRLPLVIAVVVAFLTVLVSAGSLQPTPVRGYPAPASPSRASLAALARAVAQPIPARDLYRLANQLKLRPPRRISRVARTTSPNYRVGHQDNFYILGEDNNRFFTVRATIAVETPHMYLYVQNGVHVSTAAAQKAIQHFEASIYPTDRSFFGSEWIPGVDGDPHITCLLANLKGNGIAGFFSAEDEYRRVVYPYSNQREMIYMNSMETLPGDGQFDQILSHEFQHMIHEHVHPEDNAWLNEGMSVLAEQLNHYPPVDYPTAFMQQPDTQLTGWSTDERELAHYGAAFLFLDYLYGRFGSGLIHDIVGQSRYTDLAAIDAALRRRHLNFTADGLFKQWVIANLVHDGSLAGGAYGYKRLPWHIKAIPNAVTPGGSYSGQVPPYAAQYVKVNLPADGHAFRLTFSAPSTVPIVGTSGAPFWWSNRGDMSDTRLQRTVDLTRVRHATLHFDAWWDLEKDYDYGYVEASRDGGKTWQTLHASGTVSSNPTGANYGYGYTGNIKTWRSVSLDLSPFAGHRIQLRFQMVTDDELNYQGFLVKNISIPEIGFHDNYSGWKRQGWVPIPTNMLPTNWTVQLVGYTAHGVKVTSMRTSQGRGSTTVQPGKSGLRSLVVVVYTAAPKTTVTSKFKLAAG